MAKHPPKPADREAAPRHKQRKEAKPQKRTLKDVTRALPDNEGEWGRLLAEINKGSDRVVAIMLSAQVERYLEFALLFSMSNIDKKTYDAMIARDGALATFYSKIHLAYALAVIDAKTRDQLEVIRKVRNVFAHALVAVDFITTEVAAEVLKLAPPVPEGQRAGATLLPNHRGNFTQAAMALVSTLLDKGATGSRRHALAKALMADPAGAA